MKANRIVIKNDEQLEIYIRRNESPTTCDSRTGMRANLLLKGGVTLSFVRSKKTKAAK
jgi:hypothetical protein